MGAVLLVPLLLANTVWAATPGLPFTEDFSGTELRDASLTNANWSTTEQALLLAARSARHGAFGAGLSGSDASADAHATSEAAFGDVDGDSDLDLVAGNKGSQVKNRLYLNDGTADPFSEDTGRDIGVAAYDTMSVALGDVDGDGDLDVVAGNSNQEANRLYPNDGVGDPFDTLPGSDVRTDAHGTTSVALGDVDGDGNLDLVAGNSWQANRLYLNDGVGDPFDTPSSSDVSADTHSTWSMALGDVDGDGALDLVAGNYERANRLYRRALCHTGQGQAGSLRVDAETEHIELAVLTPAATLPPNTGVTYWLSNNGGAKWFIVRPGVMFSFPTAGTDLRWRAELHSLSPVRTPRIDQIRIADQYSVNLPLGLRGPQ